LIVFEAERNIIFSDIHSSDYNNSRTRCDPASRNLNNAINYLALALRAYLQDLVTSVITAVPPTAMLDYIPTTSSARRSQNSLQGSKKLKRRKKQ